MNKISCAGIILAGGLNRRLEGQNKALLPVGDRPILDRLVSLFGQFFNQIIVVTNQPLAYIAYDVTIVTDLLPIRSSMTGIHAGLFHTQAPHAFLCACDMPFIKKELIEILMQAIEPRWDVIVPVTREGYQPLCAIYSKRCLKLIEDQLSRGDLKISNFFSRVKVKEIPEADLRAADPELVSFFNINTKEDLARSWKWSVHGE
jgi:molybdopterin-guanine dinucleotide biosynthesis protein A